MRNGKKGNTNRLKQNEEVFAQGDSLLRAIADASGGRAFFPENEKAIQEIYGQVAQLVRNEYSLAFAPPVADGKFIPSTLKSICRSNPQTQTIPNIVWITGNPMRLQPTTIDRPHGHFLFPLAEGIARSDLIVIFRGQPVADNVDAFLTRIPSSSAPYLSSRSSTLANTVCGGNCPSPLRCPAFSSRQQFNSLLDSRHRPDVEIPARHRFQHIFAQHQILDIGGGNQARPATQSIRRSGKYRKIPRSFRSLRQSPGYRHAGSWNR